MKSIFSLINTLGTLLNGIMAYFKERRLIESGKIEATLAGKIEVDNEIIIANKPVTDDERVRELSSKSNRANRRKKAGM